MNTRAFKTSATSAAVMAQGPTVAATLLQNVITGRNTGERKPHESRINAAEIAMIATARPAIEPSTMVTPVAMSALDFRRLPSGSRAHCSALNRFIAPLAIIPSPVRTPASETRGSMKPRSRSLPNFGQFVSPRLLKVRENVSCSASPAFCPASSLEKSPPHSALISASSSCWRCWAFAAASMRSAADGSSPVIAAASPPVSTRSRWGAASRSRLGSPPPAPEPSACAADRPGIACSSPA